MTPLPNKQEYLFVVSFPCLLEHFRLKSEPTTEEHLLVLPTRVGSWPYPQI